MEGLIVFFGILAVMCLLGALVALVCDLDEICLPLIVLTGVFWVLMICFAGVIENNKVDKVVTETCICCMEE